MKIKNMLLLLAFALLLLHARRAEAGEVLIPWEASGVADVPEDEATERGLDLSALTQLLGGMDLGSLLGSDNALQGILDLVGVTHPLKDCKVSPIPDQTYTGRELRPVPVVTYNGEKLKRGTDFTVSYTDNIRVGTAKIRLTGQGLYTGTRTVSFKIIRGNGQKTAAAPSRNVKLTVKLSQKSYVYNGTARKPTLKVTSGSKTVTARNYTATYKDNKNVGTATVTVKGKGEYKGFTGEATFRITLKKTSLRSASCKQAGAVMTGWTADTQADGYQLQACTNKSFSSSVRKYTVQDGRTSSQELTGLASGKKYYVRIRSFKKVGRSNWYSEWSAARQVSVK